MKKKKYLIAVLQIFCISTFIIMSLACYDSSGAANMSSYKSAYKAASAGSAVGSAINGTSPNNSEGVGDTYMDGVK